MVQISFTANLRRHPCPAFVVPGGHRHPFLPLPLPAHERVILSARNAPKS